MTALDILLPRWDFAETHRLRIADQTVDAVGAAEALTWQHMPGFRALMTVLSAGRARPAADKAVLSSMTDGGFRVLYRDADELVVGTVVRMDAPKGAIDLGADPFAFFRDCAKRGHYRVAMQFAREGDRLATSTRVAVADERSRRRFARYWAVIRIPSGLIRREWLAGARRAAADHAVSGAAP